MVWGRHIGPASFIFMVNPGTMIPLVFGGLVNPKTHSFLAFRILQDGAPKIAKLPYKWLNYGLW